MKDIANQSLASIVASHYQVVPVLEKYSLDFCCRGKETLGNACQQKGIEIEKVILELDQVLNTGPKEDLNFAAMDDSALIDHIILWHHQYVKQAMPVIDEHLTKVAFKHGDRFPHMRQVLELFHFIQGDLTAHMQKEELVLFPLIKSLSNSSADESKRMAIQAPIRMMEAEHESQGDALNTIRELTGNYTPPEGACMTFRVSLAELAEFENDLHRHVHLENHILFPRALGSLS
jgi:regulator of cell morphogenesis and NO signaling